MNKTFDRNQHSNKSNIRSIDYPRNHIVSNNKNSNINNKPSSSNTRMSFRSRPNTKSTAQSRRISNNYHIE